MNGRSCLSSCTFFCFIHVRKRTVGQVFSSFILVLCISWYLLFFAALPPRLKETDVWGQCEVLRILQRYQPQSDDELFDILSLLDQLLVSPHPLVMAATLGLFLSLCCRLPAVCHAALERVRAPLLAACGSVSREMRFAALCHIQVSDGNSDMERF